MRGPFTVTAIGAGACLAVLGGAAAVLVAGADRGPGRPVAAPAVSDAGSTAAEAEQPPVAASSDGGDVPTRSASPDVTSRDDGLGDGPPILVQTDEGVRILRPADGVSTIEPSFVLAPGAGTELAVDLGSGDSGNTVTRVFVQPVARDGPVFVRTVEGAWKLPVPVPGGSPEGISWDGSRVVLENMDDAHHFLALPTWDPSAEPVEIGPEGRFAYDALSTDGDTLFLAELPDGPDNVRRVRGVDLRRGQFLPADAVDRCNVTATAGTAMARVTTRQDVWTLFVGGPQPYVRAVSGGVAPRARCFALPDEASDQRARVAWSLAADPGGTTIAAANGVLATTYVLRGRGPFVRVQLAALAAAAPSIALAAPDRAWVRTSIGLEELDFQGPSTTVYPAPRGTTHLIATSRGVLALDSAWRPITLVQSVDG